MSSSPSFASLVPGAAAGALVATLVLVLAPSNPPPAANSPAGAGPGRPAGISDSESEMLALLREIRDELHSLAPRGGSAPPQSVARDARPLELEAPAAADARRSVGTGTDAELVAALRELNATLGRMPTHVPQSSLPPRGGQAPADRLAALGLTDYIQMLGFEDDARWEAWDEGYLKEHYGLSSAELSERYGPPDAFHPMNGGSVLWSFEHNFGDGSYAYSNFRLIDGL
ncbi:MAG: hypothetical protein ACYS26_19630 [Planctomycetota bacterium]|jgi:hypothetical protein